MNEDDIVLMARESGLASPVMTAEGNSVSMGRMTRFAELVAAATRKKCWNEINAFIKTGELPGNGCDESAQRNGLVLASNIISSGMRPNVELTGCTHQNQLHYPVEWGPSNRKRLTCSCGYPDPAHYMTHNL